MTGSCPWSAAGHLRDPQTEWNRVKTRSLIVSCLLVSGLVILCDRYLDVPVALFFDRLLQLNPRWRSYTSNIPDLLLLFVLVATALSWAGRWFLLRRARQYEARFLRLTGTCIPASYAAKELLKLGFARSNTRAWLAHQVPYEFNWFHAGAGFRGFPSGHMAVFTALGAALWLYYGRYRPVYAAGLFALGAALIATDYHFVSDVIGGVYLGLLVCLYAQHWLDAGAIAR